jgi:hypothetical protein
MRGHIMVELDDKANEPACNQDAFHVQRDFVGPP